MKRFNKIVFARLIILILLLALLGAFYEGTFEKTVMAQQNYPTPVITSVSPNVANPGESIELSVMGKYFLQGAKLSFSPQTGISVSWVKVLSPEKISVRMDIAKDASSGTRDMTITNPDQQGCTAKAGFYIKASTLPLPSPSILPAPTITGVSPAEAGAGENVELVVSGKYFMAEAQISFSPPTGISIVSLKFVSSTEIRAMISIAEDAPLGERDIKLINSDRQSYTAKASFKLSKVVVPSPAIANIPPGKTEAEKAAEPPYPVIANIPVESKIGRLYKSAHRLITGLANKAGNLLAILKIRMTDKESIRDSTFTEIGPSLERRILYPEILNVNYQTLNVSPPKRSKKRPISSPDGSATRPFPTITEALTWAEEFHYEGVEVIVSPGTYVGDLTITRPTKIIGESRTGTKIVGSIVNSSVYSLTVASLTISGPKAVTAEVGREGALVISNACASTTLERVDIKSPLNYGIFQSGGNLTARNVRIEDTAASESLASSGTAVHLSNVDAILNGIYIERAERFAIRQIGGSLHMFADQIQNTKTRDEISKAGTSIWTSDGAKTEILSSIIGGSQSSALIIEGNQTEAVLENVNIYDTKVNPWLMQEHIIVLTPDLPLGPAMSPLPITIYPKAFAAIEIQQEAQLTMRRSSIDNNEYMGLRVVDNAQARITNTRFSHTRGYVGSESGSWTGGTNIQAKNNGYIYLENITSQHADLCGLQLYGGTADYHAGEVSYNLVGVHITTAGFDIRRLQDRVVYFANGRDLDMEALPVPEPSVPTVD